MLQPAPLELEGLASLAGKRWAAAYVRVLRAEHRAVEGGWPCTVSEAYGRLIVDLADQVRTLSPQRIRALSRIAYQSARAAWVELAGADPER